MARVLCCANVAMCPRTCSKHHQYSPHGFAMAFPASPALCTRSTCLSPCSRSTWQPPFCALAACRW
eukprot:4182915-Amphidinium_carterae.1